MLYSSNHWENGQAAWNEVNAGPLGADGAVLGVSGGAAGGAVVFLERFEAV